MPKMILVAPPRDGGVISTRSFIPHRAHATIGVFAALSVATACLLPESPAHGIARPQGRQGGTRAPATGPREDVGGVNHRWGGSRAGVGDRVSETGMTAPAISTSARSSVWHAGTASDASAAGTGRQGSTAHRGPGREDQTVRHVASSRGSGPGRQRGVASRARPVATAPSRRSLPSRRRPVGARSLLRGCGGMWGSERRRGGGGSDVFGHGCDATARLSVVSAAQTNAGSVNTAVVGSSRRPARLLASAAGPVHGVGGGSGVAPATRAGPERRRCRAEGPPRPIVPASAMRSRIARSRVRSRSAVVRERGYVNMPCRTVRRRSMSMIATWGSWPQNNFDGVDDEDERRCVLAPCPRGFGAVEARQTPSTARARIDGKGGTTGRGARPDFSSGSARQHADRDQSGFQGRDARLHPLRRLVTVCKSSWSGARPYQGAEPEGAGSGHDQHDPPEILRPSASRRHHVPMLSDVGSRTDR